MKRGYFSNVSQCVSPCYVIVRLQFLYIGCFFFLPLCLFCPRVSFAIVSLLPSCLLNRVSFALSSLVLSVVSFRQLPTCLS
jgi:hypothetical protein